MKATTAPPKKPKPKKNLVRAALRAATNRPPRSCAHALDLIAEYSDQETGRNAFMSVGTLMKRLRRGERQTRAMMVRLRAGGWIAEQTEGPDAHAVVSYHKLYPDPRHRAPVHRLVLATLSCPRGAESAPLTLVVKGCGNGHVRGAETDTEGVRLAADTPSFSISETSSLHAVTDSFQNLSRETPPPRAGVGSGSVADPDGSDSAPDPTPTQTELRQTVRAALRILEKPLAIMSTEASHKMTAALEKITARGKCCLECALLVPYWVMHGSPPRGLDENLQGMNARTSLTYLWGPAWGDLMGRATADARDSLREDHGPGDLDRKRFDELLADLASTDRTRLYDEDTRYPEPDDEAIDAMSQAIHDACRWCPKRRNGR